MKTKRQFQNCEKGRLLSRNFFHTHRVIAAEQEDIKNGVFWVVTPCGSCGVTTQKTPFFIVTAVKTSNLTRRYYSELLRF
jgi:hypothetical protein